MRNHPLSYYIVIGGMCLACTACLPSLTKKEASKQVPASFASSSDTTNSAKVKWKDFFTDPNLRVLIDTALMNNQELNIVQQEIVQSQNEVRARKGQYLPFLSVGAGAGLDKQGRYTRLGSVDDQLEIKDGQKFPDPLTDFMLSANVSWELDVWKRLRNSKKSAMLRYLASTEGRNFMVTLLIAEIADSYYELMALDNQLDILQKYIDIQNNALDMVRLQKDAAKVTELAVRRFEAEVLKNQSRLYDIKQQITITENHINFLVGRFPQPIARNSQVFIDMIPNSIQAGIPSQLLTNRPDIRRAEQQMAAAKLDIKIAKANFYPNFTISAGAGYQAFNPKYLINSPQSVLYYLGGQLVAPLINRNSIKAEYSSANARQIQSVYNFQRAILNAHIEVANQLSNINNLENSYSLKNKQVQTLVRSIEISTGLFNSARADYMEVLLTQRDALEARFELVEIKKRQMSATVNIYQALGGGWN